MSRAVYHCELAWLGGDHAVADVLVEVDGDRIVTVTPGSPVDELPAGTVRLAGLTLPGLANAHSHAFHRALRSEEVRIQFRGKALDMSETGNADTAPGTVTMIPRGIGHSVITDPVDCTQFLRMNFYSELPWSAPHDVTKHHFDSHFDVETHIVQKAPWRA